MRKDLRGQVAVVTGGSRGIGLAIARALAAEGARVAITARNAQHLLDARAVLETGHDADAIEALRADVRRADEIADAIAATVARFGGIDILVNNAGVGHFGHVVDLALEQWTEVVETNLTGAFNACRAALPHMKARGGGSIVNISSLAGANPFAGGAAYCASKAGLNAFSESLMQEVRYDNIRVSCVMPGSVATEFGGHDATQGADWKIAPEDVADVVLGLLRHDPRSLPSRVEIRPTRPRK